MTHFKVFNIIEFNPYNIYKPQILPKTHLSQDTIHSPSVVQQLYQQHSQL